MRSRVLVLVTVALVTLLALAGWGAGARHDEAAAAPAASMATVRTARCHDWNQMSTQEQARLLVGMRVFFSGVVDSPGMRGKALPDDEAHRVLDGFCEEAFADQFTLYRLYGSAAAFTPESQG